MGYSNVLEIATETEPTFGTDFGENFPRAQHVLENTMRMRPLQGAIPDLTAVTRLHHRKPNRRGSQFGSGFSASLYIDGLPAALNAAGSYSAPQTSLAEVLLAGFGGVLGAAGSLVDSTSGGGAASTTSIPVTAGQGARFAIGTYLMISGVPRKVTARATDRLTIHPALPTAPADGTPIYNSVTFYLAPGSVGGDGQSLVVRVLGYDANDQTIFRGVVPVITAIRSAFDEQLVLDVDFMAAMWEQITGASPTATLVGAGPLPAIVGRHWIGNVADSVNLALESNSFVVRPGLSAVPQKSFGSNTVAGVQTVRRWRQMRQTAGIDASIRFLTQADWDTWRDYYHSLATTMRPRFHHILQFGNEPIVSGAGTGCVVFGLPNCHFAQSPARVEADGQIQLDMSWQAAEDQAGTVSDAASSAITISLF